MRKGRDYPVGFVRWTEQRNFQAVLDMMAAGRLDLGPLVSHRFRIDEAKRAYEMLATGRPLGIILDYPASDEKSEQATRHRTLQLHRGRPMRRLERRQQSRRDRRGQLRHEYFDSRISVDRRASEDHCVK